MAPLQILPVALSLLVLGAHFLRAGSVVVLVAVLLLGVLFVPRPWAARTVQVALVLGAVEWIRTLLRLASDRAGAGEPALRIVVILGSVAAVTLLSALLFQTRTLRRVYRIDPKAASPP